MPRNIAITAIDSNIGLALAESLLDEQTFAGKVDFVHGLSLHPNSQNARAAKERDVVIWTHKAGSEQELLRQLKTKEDVGMLCLIPPADKYKYELTIDLIDAAHNAGIDKVLLISCAGADVADRVQHYHLREIVDLERHLQMTTEWHCVIRAGFFVENVVLYAPNLLGDGQLPIPIAKGDKFAPVAVKDVATLAAHILTAHSQHGDPFVDNYRSQVMALTGPELTTGDDLATAATEAFGQDITFESIGEARAARELKHSADGDASELKYLLEYYTLTYQGRANYVSTMAFASITGKTLCRPVDAFKKMALEDQSAEGDKGDGQQEDGGPATKKRKLDA